MYRSKNQIQNFVKELPLQFHTVTYDVFWNILKNMSDFTDYGKNEDELIINVLFIANIISGESYSIKYVNNLLKSNNYTLGIKHWIIRNILNYFNIQVQTKNELYDQILELANLFSSSIIEYTYYLRKLLKISGNEVIYNYLKLIEFNKYDLQTFPFLKLSLLWNQMEELLKIDQTDFSFLFPSKLMIKFSLDTNDQQKVLENYQIFFDYIDNKINEHLIKNNLVKSYKIIIRAIFKDLFVKNEFIQILMNGPDTFDTIISNVLFNLHTKFGYGGTKKDFDTHIVTLKEIKLIELLNDQIKNQEIQDYKQILYDLSEVFPELEDINLSIIPLLEQYINVQPVKIKDFYYIFHAINFYYNFLSNQISNKQYTNLLFLKKDKLRQYEIMVLNYFYDGLLKKYNDRLHELTTVELNTRELLADKDTVFSLLEDTRHSFNEIFLIFICQGLSLKQIIQVLHDVNLAITFNQIIDIFKENTTLVKYTSMYDILNSNQSKSEFVDIINYLLPFIISEKNERSIFLDIILSKDFSYLNEYPTIYAIGLTIFITFQHYSLKKNTKLISKILNLDLLTYSKMKNSLIKYEKRILLDIIKYINFVEISEMAFINNILATYEFLVKNNNYFGTASSLIFISTLIHSPEKILQRITEFEMKFDFKVHKIQRVLIDTCQQVDPSLKIENFASYFEGSRTRNKIASVNSLIDSINNSLTKLEEQELSISDKLLLYGEKELNINIYNTVWGETIRDIVFKDKKAKKMFNTIQLSAVVSYFTSLFQKTILKKQIKEIFKLTETELTETIEYFSNNHFSELLDLSLNYLLENLSLEENFKRDFFIKLLREKIVNSQIREDPVTTAGIMIYMISSITKDTISQRQIVEVTNCSINTFRTRYSQIQRTLGLEGKDIEDLLDPNFDEYAIITYRKDGKEAKKFIYCDKCNNIMKIFPANDKILICSACSNRKKI